MNKKSFCLVFAAYFVVGFSVFAAENTDEGGVILPPLTPEITKTIGSNLQKKSTEKTIAKKKKNKKPAEPPASLGSSAPSAKKMIEADANANVPMSYQKDSITIMRKFIKNPVSENGEVGLLETMPWQVEKNSLILPVEIWDGLNMYNQKGWMDLGGYKENTGVMMVFPTLGIYPIVPMEMYAPVDIFFIDKLGKIVSIAPDLVLANLEAEIEPKSPIIAYLFMKGGSRDTLSISVGDEIMYSLFKKPPPLIEAPPTPVAPLAELPPQPQPEPTPQLQTQQVPPVVARVAPSNKSGNSGLGKTEIPNNPPPVTIIK